MTQDEFNEYLGAVDPVLQRLEALTNEAIHVRTLGSVQDTVDLFANRLPSELLSLEEALIDAKGRLIGMDRRSVRDR